MKTTIEWADFTFNPWRGCSKVHAGCANCYAEREAKRFPTNRGVWGPNGTRVKASPDMWREPLKWNKQAEKAGDRSRVFCASLADVFEDWQGDIHTHDGDTCYTCSQCGYVGCWPLIARQRAGGLVCPKCQAVDSNVPTTMKDLRSDLFALIDATQNLDWLLLTKRPENVRRMMPWRTNGLGEQDSGFQATQYRPNVWLGTSISDQETADRYIPELLKLRDLAPVLFLSVEPLLAPVDLEKAGAWLSDYTSIDWVICGGESGPRARPMHPEWVKSIRDECDICGTPFFFKQWGEWRPDWEDAEYGDPANVMAVDGTIRTVGPMASSDALIHRVGKKTAGRMLDNRTWDELPGVRQ